MELQSISTSIDNDGMMKHHSPYSPGTLQITYSPIVASCHHLLQPNGSIVGRHVARTILPLFPSICSAIPADFGTERHALASIDGRRPISHSRIRDFILAEFGTALHGLGFGRGHRIAVVLPNGPELALAILGITNWATCVPLNANGAKSELEADLMRCGADLVIGPYTGTIASHDGDSPDVPPDETFRVMPGDGNVSVAFQAFEHVEETARKLGIPFVGLIPSKNESGIFHLFSPPPHLVGSPPVSHNGEANHLRKPETNNDYITRFQANAHDDEVLVLFTSGTTGSKKIVAHQLGDMLVAAATIALSWNLTPIDINCNLMPLFHVGGIVRQVFSPILSGGCVICCPSFDPNIFWALVAKKVVTWYYAAPTMHQLILQAGRERVYDDSPITLEQQTKPKLRMIANAAGGLLPSLARQLRETFHANVLPSYGMTECMPISSPPATYQLEKPGTSGVAVGPEIAILNPVTLKPLPVGAEGPICVRGEPCFRGYGENHTELSPTHQDTFLEGGWFNTGDLGHMDSDGYLYITGRSKEVINRGGEIISPMEVEEAVVSHPDVVACAAFSALHEVLQEVVGIVIVPVQGRPRLDMQTLHDFLGERLATLKWPQCLVFMDGLPKSHTNKLLRVQLGPRLGLPELNDGMYPIERTFQAKCPAQGTSLQIAIPSERVSVSAADVQHKLTSTLMANPTSDQQLLVVPHPSRIGSLVCYVLNVNRALAIQIARQTLDRYAVPSHFVELKKIVKSERELLPPQPADAISSILNSTSSKEPLDPLVKEIQQLFLDLLDLDCAPAPDSNFFNLGGSSMLASQLASRIRKRHEIPFSGAEVFHHASCNALAAVIRQRGQEAGGTSNDGSIGPHTGSQGDPSVSSNQGSGFGSSVSSFHKNVETHGAPFPAGRLAPKGSFRSSLVQLMPLCVVFPIFQITRFYLFFSFLLLSLTSVPGERNIITFVVTLVVFHFLWVLITPLVFVMLKWILIGRYRQGRYAIWSNYYLRWWFVDVCRKLFGRGFWGSNEILLACYYRMLGAKIGSGVRISLEADVAEYDLVSIGDNAAIEYATVRGFGVDNGAMILGPVVVGSNASVGARSVVAPYTSVPDGKHLGPVTSSYDMGSLKDEHANVNRRSLPQPSFRSQLLIGSPITYLVNGLSHLPALLVLYWMVQMPWHKDDVFETMGDLMEWLCEVRRIPFYIGIRVVRATVAPVIHMLVSIVVKWCIIGKFQPGPRDTTSEWQLLRHWLSASLFSRQNMQEVTELLGRHYELVSCLYRLLGAKIGKRVFWPGHQPIFSGEFELLEIGDDVVFGSRSAILCTTADSCKKVILCAGSNLSDNSIALPGSIIGKNAVLGSNSVCPEGWYLPESSVWFGSRGGKPICLEGGVDGIPGEALLSSEVNPDKLQFEGDETTLRPFGKAFYMREAPYYVLPLSFIMCFTLFTKIAIAVFHTLPLLGALHGAAGVLYGFPIAERHYDDFKHSTPTVYVILLIAFMITHLIRVFIWLTIDLGAKWFFMGRREEGRYNYDTSSYAQNWELYQIVGKARKFGRFNILDFISGTPFMATYFRLNGCKIGKDCCLYPAGGDPYMPEPDLVEMGDRCVVDCASIVCHLNTRGNFELAKIVMENHVTLRSRSRIQEGVYIEAGSMLLEKSLAMTGEVIEADTVWQGAPAACLFQYSHEAVRPSTSFTTGPPCYSHDGYDAMV